VEFLVRSYPISDLAALLEGLEQGSVAFGESRFSTSDYSFASARCWLESGQANDMTEIWPDFQRFHRFRLQADQALNVEQMLLPPREPWRIAQLGGERVFSELTFRQVRVRVGDSWTCRIVVLAPLLVATDLTSPDPGVGDHLALRVKVHCGLPLDAMRLEYFLQDGRSLQRARQKRPLQELRHVVSDFWFSGEEAFPIGDDIVSVGASIFYDRYLSGADPVITSTYPITRWERPAPVRSHQDEALLAPGKESQVSAINDALKSRGPVFLIHGHDEMNLLRLKSLLRDELDVEAIILSQKPGGSDWQCWGKRRPRANIAATLTCGSATMLA
jgi:hypothetical protein